MDTDDNPEVEFAASIACLALMPAYLDSALAELTREGQRRRPDAQSFCLLEHACHLRDLEREGYLVRVRRMMDEREPALEPFDGAAVAAARNYLVQDAGMAAREFGAARGEVVALLAALAPDDLKRTASFAGKRIHLQDLVTLMLEHDGEHRREIERLIDPAREAQEPWK